MKINGKECPYQYCISCEVMTPVFSSLGHHHHHKLVYYAEGAQEESCDGPFESCPPPPEMTEEMWDAVLAENVP